MARSDMNSPKFHLGNFRILVILPLPHQNSMTNISQKNLKINTLVQDRSNFETTSANSFSRQSFGAQKFWRESSCLKAQVP
ncbi:MAG: hypothetical protein DRR19_28680 [Candidatus Parabeggiatoa sp. nov. 1]|nr:MAG: hypothetical protein DRR19_28680 [Gammaproteobacteria bacterium]